MGNASGGMGGSERYEDGGGPEGPSGIPWRGSKRLFALGAEREGASVSVTNIAVQRTADSRSSSRGR